MLGNGRLEAQCFDGTKRLAHIRVRFPPVSPSKYSLTPFFFFLFPPLFSLATAYLTLPQGKLRKKVWINVGDIILLSLRSYQDEKGDVILKYNADEARSLKAYGELPETAKINETDLGGPEGDGDYGFEFDEDRDSDSSEEEGGAGGAGGKEIEIDDI